MGHIAYLLHLFICGLVLKFDRKFEVYKSCQKPFFLALCLPSIFSLVLYKGTESIVAKWWEQVYGWGRGEHGRLGFGDDKSSKMIPQKVHTLESEFIVQVYSKLFYTDMYGCWLWIEQETNFTLHFMKISFAINYAKFPKP